MLQSTIQTTEIRGKGKVVPVSTVQTCNGIINGAVFTPSAGARWKSVVKLLTWPLCQVEIIPAPTKQESGYNPEPVRTFRRKYLDATWNRPPARRSLNLGLCTNLTL